MEDAATAEIRCVCGSGLHAWLCGVYVCAWRGGVGGWGGGGVWRGSGFLAAVQCACSAAHFQCASHALRFSIEGCRAVPASRLAAPLPRARCLRCTAAAAPVAPAAAAGASRQHASATTPCRPPTLTPATPTPTPPQPLLGVAVAAFWRAAGRRAAPHRRPRQHAHPGRAGWTAQAGGRAAPLAAGWAELGTRSGARRWAGLPRGGALFARACMRAPTACQTFVRAPHGSIPPRRSATRASPRGTTSPPPSSSATWSTARSCRCRSALGDSCTQPEPCSRRRRRRAGAWPAPRPSPPALPVPARLPHPVFPCGPPRAPCSPCRTSSPCPPTTSLWPRSSGPPLGRGPAAARAAVCEAPVTRVPRMNHQGRCQPRRRCQPAWIPAAHRSRCHTRPPG